MTVDWTFTFVKINPELLNKPKIELMCTFRDGICQMIAHSGKFPEVIKQMENIMMLLTYIAFFPNKDFNKIKLEIAGNRYAIHFLDKKFLNEGYLGILSVSEMDYVKNFTDWGVEEMMEQYIFDYYLDLKKNSTNGMIQIEDFKKWLQQEIYDFYMDWAEAKKKFFSSPKVIHKISDIENKAYEHWWDLQLINEYGQPLTDLISFLDKESYIFHDEEVSLAQSLESMSISALKLLIDQQGGWNIRYIKMRQRNQMGFQYVFFEKFEIRGIKYLLIMNSALFDIDKGVCLQAFRGDEIGILENISSKLQQKPFDEFFMENGQIKHENRKNVQEVIIKYFRSSH